MKFRSAMSLIDIADLAIPEMVLRSITQNPKLSFLRNVAKRSNGTRKKPQEIL